MLVFWTAAKVANVRATIGRTLSTMKPVPLHRFVEFKEGEVLEAAGGEIVVACGTKPVDALKAAGVLPKNRGVNKLRGKAFQASAEKGRYMVTFDPGLVDREPEKGGEMDWDVRLAVRLFQTGSLDPQTGEYEWVDSFAGLIKAIEAQYEKTGKAVDVSCDTETMGFYPWYADKHIVCIGFTHRGGFAQAAYTVKQVGLGKYADAVVGTPLHAEIAWLLTSPKVKLKMANGKFDLVWVRQKWGIDCTNFKFDTLLVGSLVDETRSNSLNNHAKTYTTMGGYDDRWNETHDKSHMERIARDDLLPYIGGDVDATHRTADALKGELLRDPELANFYVKLLQPAARAFEKIEARGVLVDQEKYAVLGEDLRTEIARLQKEALALMPRRLRIKHSEKIGDQLENGKNPLTPAILKDFFFGPRGLNLAPKMTTEKTGEPSTAKAHLQMFSDHPEAKLMCDVLEQMNSAEKTLSTYVDGFLKHLRPDGRFHASYMLFHGGFMGDDDEAGTVCVTEDTLFLTSRGYVPFKEVRVGDSVLSHTGQARRVEALVDNGVKGVVRVTLTDGREIDCTLNHPFLAEGGWVEAGDLTVGQKVQVYGPVEEWRVIPDWSDFEVSSYGRVRNRKTGRIRATFPKGKWGHRKVTLIRNGAQGRKGGDKKDFVVHRLVAQAFVPNPDGLPEVRHRNGIAWDNTATNLVWGTTADNRGDMALHCTGQGAHGSQAKITWDDVRWLELSGLSDARAAKVLGVSRELVRDIRSGKRWVQKPKHIDRSGFAWGVIASVVHQGLQPTFGVTVAEDHSHVTQGIVTHNTGRLSARDPAIQTVPKKTKWAKRLRECFVAPPGKVVWQCDFSQGELRVVACVAPEPRMIEAYQKGLDLHSVTASSMSGMTLDDFMALEVTNPDLFNRLRTNGKAGNFGLLYGMSAEGFVAYAWANYGVKLTVEEAEKLRQAFLYESWPGLPKYHDRIKLFAKQHGYVRSPLGRVRHLPHIYSRDNFTRSGAERQAINSPIQSTLSDMMLLSIAMIEDVFPNGEIEIVGMIHDSIFGYVDEAYAEERVRQVVEIMSNLPLTKLFGWEPQLVFPADAEIGPNLAQLKKQKFDKVAA